jgi:hypothetical protein
MTEQPPVSPSPQDWRRPTAEPPRKRGSFRTILLVGGGIFVVLVVIAALGTLSDEETAQQATDAEAVADPSLEAADSDEQAVDPVEEGGDDVLSLPTFGDPAPDGQFTFTAQNLDCGETVVGPDYLEERAQGVFCLLQVRVENTGDQAQSLFADNQLLIDRDGTQYRSSDMATIVHSDGSQTIFSEINPGNAVEGTIVFDVPPGVEIIKAQFHDSAFSGGVQVHLGSNPT